jgi:outer membrane murein-binding lipoprotein Lpp|tara:strand:- start:358 stop:618 length:261 start_codon:yes stop_codon:yes gene_type:complete
MKTDMLWKIFTVILGTLIMPLAGWVWNTNVKITELQNDLGDVEAEVASLSEEVEKYEEATRTLIGVERDIQHVREILNRIEELIVQ